MAEAAQRIIIPEEAIDFPVELSAKVCLNGDETNRHITSLTAILMLANKINIDPLVLVDSLDRIRTVTNSNAGEFVIESNDVIQAMTSMVLEDTNGQELATISIQNSSINFSFSRLSP